MSDTAQTRRLLFVDHTPIAGGAELALAHHLRALDRSRYTPIVACTDAQPSLIELYREAGAEVHVVSLPRLRGIGPRRLVGVLRAAHALRALARRLRIELVVANTSRAAYIAALALVGTRLPLVWWVRDFEFGRWVFRLLAPAANRLICVSESVRHFYGGDDDPRFVVVYVGTGIHHALRHVTDDAVARERARWGFTPEDTVVGFMARLVEEKGPEDVLSAATLLHERDPRVKLLLVGRGTGEPGDVEPTLRARAASCAAYVVFTGFQRDEALYYRLFDVFVLASRWQEGFATSVVQAMMAGTPVVATDTGGTRELVRDGETGLLVRARAPERIVAAIERLLANPTLRARVVRQAREYVLVHNVEEATTARVERVYEDLLARGTRGRSAVLSAAQSRPKAERDAYEIDARGG